MLILSKKIIKRKKEKIFYNHYKNIFFKALENLHLNDLETISKIIEKKIIQKKNIFVAGNGGSASVANHFLCDFNKGIKLSSKKKMMPKVISLSNSIELITAISNDIKYEKVFSFQLENYANKNDLLITFSSSGSSKNIIELINTAKNIGLKIISISGFGEGNLKADVRINLKCKNYGPQNYTFIFPKKNVI